MSYLPCNPRLRTVTVPTAHGPDYLRAMILEDEGAEGALLARIEDVGIFSDVSYHDTIIVRDVDGRFEYLRTVEPSSYNTYVCVAHADDTDIGPRLACVGPDIAGRAVRIDDVAIVSVAAPPSAQPTLEHELQDLLREKRIRDLVRVITREPKARRGGAPA